MWKVPINSEYFFLEQRKHAQRQQKKWPSPVGHFPSCQTVWLAAVWLARLTHHPFKTQRKGIGWMNIRAQADYLFPSPAPTKTISKISPHTCNSSRYPPVGQLSPEWRVLMSRPLKRSQRIYPTSAKHKTEHPKQPLTHPSNHPKRKRIVGTDWLSNGIQRTNYLSGLL